MNPIRPQRDFFEKLEKQVLFMNKNLFRKSTTKQQQRKHLGFD